MASSKRKQDGEKTVKTVVNYAATLRDRADAAKAGDPHVELYRPSSDTARKLCSQLGPDGAMSKLAERARRAELRHEEEESWAASGRERHRELHLVVAGETAAERGRLTLGQRLDVAFLGLGGLSEVSAARLDSDLITGSGGGGGVPFRQRREVENLLADAEHLVAKAERELASSRRRVVEEERAA